MRDRLIELIRTGVNKHEVTIENYVVPTSDYLADYLLANGVIVPSVKCGDHVFIVLDGEIIPTCIDAVYIRLFDGSSKDTEKHHRFRCAGIYGYFEFTDIGKEVFFTKEEAEQALKGGVEE